MNFGDCTRLCNHHCGQDAQLFRQLQRFPRAFQTCYLLPAPSPKDLLSDSPCFVWVKSLRPWGEGNQERGDGPLTACMQQATRG